MSAAIELANYLATVVFPAGPIVRSPEAPNETDEVVWVLPAGSHRRDGYTFGKVCFKYPRLQVMVRSTTKQAAQALSYVVMDALNRKGNLTMDGTLWYWIETLEPAWAGPDAQNRPRFSVNVNASKEPS